MSSAFLAQCLASGHCQMLVSFSFACLLCLVQGRPRRWKCASLGRALAWYQHHLWLPQPHLPGWLRRSGWDRSLCLTSFTGESSVWPGLRPLAFTGACLGYGLADLISKTEAPTFLREGGARDLVWGESKSASLGWPVSHHLWKGTGTPLSSSPWASLSSWSTPSFWLEEWAGTSGCCTPTFPVSFI